MVEASYVLCWSAKWEGEATILYERTTSMEQSSRPMVQKIHRLMEEADHIVTHNGIKFDLPTLNKEFLLKGMSPPAPAHYTDTLQVARRRFRFTSNSLDYLAQRLGVGKKVKHEGFTLWVKCMKGDKKAWADMEQYNRHDVTILEGVYHKLRPWIKTRANLAVRSEHNHTICPNCGSDKYQYRGFQYSQVAKYARAQCLKCHSWFRHTVNELERKAVKSVPI